MADAEIRWYKSKWPGFKGVAQVSEEMYSGLMVSRDRLFIGKDLRIPEHRAEALLQHEVGTHLLTYFNGREQPFKMLQYGLPGYDALQEGIAVLSEHLVGGLTADRLRVLAGRVIAAGSVHELKGVFAGKAMLEVTAPRILEAQGGIETLAGVREVSVFGTRLHAVVDDSQRTSDRIRERLSELGNIPVRVERIVPSLEDVFIHCIESDDEAGKVS